MAVFVRKLSSINSSTNGLFQEANTIKYALGIQLKWYWKALDKHAALWPVSMWLRKNGKKKKKETWGGDTLHVSEFSCVVFIWFRQKHTTPFLIDIKMQRVFRSSTHHVLKRLQCFSNIIWLFGGNAWGCRAKKTQCSLTFTFIEKWC